MNIQGIWRDLAQEEHPQPPEEFLEMEGSQLPPKMLLQLA